MNVRGKKRVASGRSTSSAPGENRIRYDTPSLMGARASASYGESKGWSVGLSYAGAPPGVKKLLRPVRGRLSASATTTRPPSPCPAASSIRRASTSTGTTTRTAKPESKEGIDDVKNSQWGVSGRLERQDQRRRRDFHRHRLQPLDRRAPGQSRSNTGLAIVQKVDAAAADIYAGVSYDSGTVTHTR